MDIIKKSVLLDALRESSDVLASGEAGAFLKFIESNLEDNGYEITLTEIKRK